MSLQRSISALELVDATRLQKAVEHVARPVLCFIAQSLISKPLLVGVRGALEVWRIIVGLLGVIVLLGVSVTIAT
jgi:hypothetical protein